MVVNSFVVVSSLMIFILLFFTAFLFYKGRHIYSNVLLGIYLACQIIGIVNTSFFFLKDYLLPDYVNLYFTGYPIIFAWVVLYYFFISSLIDSRFRIKSYNWLHFVPFLVVLFIMSRYFYFFGADEKLKLLEPQSGFYKIIRVLDVIFSIQIIIYNVIVIIKYSAYRKRVQKLINVKPEYDMWIRLAIFTFLGACIISIIVKFIGYLNISLEYSTFLISYVAFLFFYSILFFVTITSPNLVQINDKKEKYWYSSLSRYEAMELMAKLNLFVTETQIYRRSKLTLKELASGIKVSERHLSQAINDIRGQNFFDFVNSYRIEHAKSLLSNNPGNKRTIFDIFWESGFNSKTTFNTTFKKITGQTPTEYQKSLPIA